MGLLDKLNKSKDLLLYDEFESWMSNVFQNDISDEVCAINFNIYEDADGRWSLEVVGTSSFDENDEDWACDEVTDFNTRDNMFVWKQDISWKEALSSVKDIISKYLEIGEYSYILKNLDGVACGFVDGNLEIIHIKDE